MIGAVDMDEATEPKIHSQQCPLHIRARAHPAISSEDIRRIDVIGAEIRANSPRIEDVQMFGPGVVKGCGSGPGLWFGDTAEIPLMGRNPGKRFDYRMGWLAADGDIVVIGGPSCKPFETYQRDWLQAPGLTYLNVDPKSKPPRISTLAMCLRDPDIYGRLVAALDGATGVTLHAHQTTGRAWALASRLSQDLDARIHVAGPPPTLSRLANDKLWFGDVAQMLFGTGATPEKRAAYSASALTRHVADLAQKRARLVIKLPDSAGSEGNFILAARDIRGLTPRRLRDRLLKKLSLAGCEGRFPMLVEVWDANVLANPSVQTWIPRTTQGLPLIEGIFEQILGGDRAAFAGAAPAEPPRDIEDALCRDALRLAVLFQKLGYFGRCSFDTVVTGEHGAADTVHWIECNARWGGVSVPMTLVNRLAMKCHMPHYVIVQNESGGFPPLPFCKALQDLSDLALSPDLQSGVLFLSPNLMEAGLGNHFLAFGKDRKLARASVKAVLQRLQVSD
jgi:hypothetical protein